MSSGDSVCRETERETSVGESRDQDPHEGTAQRPHPRGDDDRLESFKHGLNGQGGVHTAVGKHTGHTGPGRGRSLSPPHAASHLKCRMGLVMVGVLSSKGSMIMVKPGGGGGC